MQVRFRISRRPLIASSVAVAVTALIATLVLGTGIISESHTFQFWEGGFYLVSHPLCTALGSAAALEAELKAQNPDNPNLKLDVAVFSQNVGEPPTWDCYPVGSTIIEDFYDPNSPFGTCTSTNSLSWGSREAILIRVRDVSEADCEAPATTPVCTPPSDGCGSGGCIELNWSGTDQPYATYNFTGNAVDDVISVPFNLTPITAGEVLAALPFGGTVARVMPTLPPVFQFWTGSLGNGVVGDFTAATGEGLIVRSIGPSQVLPLFALGGAKISGTVFNDDDTNGSFGGSDTGMANRRVRLIHQGSGQVYGWTRTDTNGAYEFDSVVPDLYLVDVFADSGEVWSPAGGSLSVNPVSLTDVLTGNDLGREPVHDLQVSLYRLLPTPLRSPCSTAASPGNRVDYCVRLENVGSYDEDGTHAVLDIPPAGQATYLSSYVGECTSTPAPAGPTVVGTELTWAVTSPFEPGDACTVCATVQVEGPLNDFLAASTAIYLDGSGTEDDIMSTRNVDAIVDRDRCAVDPNDLQVTPAGCGSDGFVERGSPFTYLIRFQNNGTAPATLVEITDILDGSLDLSTLELRDASHTLTGLEVLPDRRLILTFDNINLPPSSSDPDGSQGFVLFEISARAGITSGTRIPNTASIVFDLNDPLLTNETITTVTDNVLPASGLPGAEICNDVDDDCDGTVDQFATSCGVGECAAVGTCVAGVDSCIPGTPQAEACDGLDNDCDGTADNLPPPAGSSTIAASDLSGWVWTVQVDADGYDVVRGDVETLSTGGFTPAVDACLADDQPGTSLVDTDTPDPGALFWYLQRGTNCGVPATYGTVQRDADIDAAASSCP